MSGPKMGGGTASSAIPASDKKLIARLKEIVSNSEDEIYAMLKECNRDPDETVQRLLIEGKFHVVKRKREKKKETTSNKDSSDSRSGFSSGASIRGGRSSGVLGRGVGRGSSLSRSSTFESNGGRSSKASALRENGTAPPKISNSGSGILSYSQLVQPKTSSIDCNHLPPSHPNANGEMGQMAQFSALPGSWPAGLGTAAPASLQGAWLAGAGRGQGTIADMLKSSGMRTTGPSVPTVQCDNEFQQPVLTPIISSRDVSSPYMEVLSPVPPGSVESSMQGLITMSQPGVQYNGEESFLLNHQNGDGLSTVPLGAQVTVEQLDSYLEQSGHPSELVQSSSISLDASLQGLTSPVQYSNSSAYPVHYYAESQEDAEDCEQVEDDASSVEATDTPSEGVRSTGVSPSAVPSYSDAVSTAAAKLQELHVRDEQSVIIPDHLRVSDADCTKLSFGSFESGIGPLSSNFPPESKSASSMFGDGLVNDPMAGASEPVAVSTSADSGVEHHADLPATMDNIVTATGGTTLDNSMGAKPEETNQLRPQDPYLGAPPSFPPGNLVTQEQESHYVAEHSGSRAQDISRLSNVLPYPDIPAAGTYYSGVFRSSPDADAQYSAFLPSAATGKYGAIRPAGHEQNPVAPEIANNLVFPSPSTVAQTLPSVNIPSVQQQSLPIHAYATQPSAVHLGPYANVLGYHQYMPPGFNYLQNHYQQNLCTALKYSMPQYKQSASMNVGMHSTVTPGASAYGGYGNSQPGYTLSPPVATGNSPNFDDVPAQYKDANMYIPAQQVEGSSNWLQSPLSRDLPGGSFYNVHGQTQQARYSQAQSLNAHSLPGAAVYNNLFRPQQSGSTPNAHQLLQQHQALGSVSGLGSQIGSYQQAQRGQQQSWANGF